MQLSMFSFMFGLFSFDCFVVFSLFLGSLGVSVFFIILLHRILCFVVSIIPCVDPDFMFPLCFGM